MERSFEELEDRTVPAFTVDFTSGILTIDNPNSEAITVGALSGNVTINGLTTVPGFGTLPSASLVTAFKYYGGTGNDNLSLSGMSIVDYSSLLEILVYGNSGNDQIVGMSSFGEIESLTGTSATYYGEDGDDNIFGAGSLVGGNGNDTLTADFLSTYLDGGAGNDVLTGSSGFKKLFRGGTGNDTMTAGNGDPGTNLFVMENNWGQDTITGSNFMLDVLDFSGTQIGNLLGSDFKAKFDAQGIFVPSTEGITFSAGDSTVPTGRTASGSIQGVDAVFGTELDDYFALSNLIQLSRDYQGSIPMFDGVGGTNTFYYLNYGAAVEVNGTTGFATGVPDGFANIAQVVLPPQGGTVSGLSVVSLEQTSLASTNNRRQA